jgi:hypothetical protein
MGRPEFPTINGADTSWADLTLAFPIYGGKVFRTADFSAVKIDESVDPGEKRGKGSRASGSTVGTYKANASVSLYIGAHLQFIEALKVIAKQRQIPITLVTFEVAGFFKTPGSPKQSFQVLGARVIGRTLDLKNSNEATEVETPLWTPLARMNGVSLIEIPT